MGTASHLQIVHCLWQHRCSLCVISRSERYSQSANESPTHCPAKPLAASGDEKIEGTSQYSRLREQAANNVDEHIDVSVAASPAYRTLTDAADTTDEFPLECSIPLPRFVPANVAVRAALSTPRTRASRALTF